MISLVHLKEIVNFIIKMLCLFTEPHVIRDMEVHVFIPSVETNPRLLRKTIPDLPPYPAFRSIISPPLQQLSLSLILSSCLRQSTSLTVF